MKKTLFISLVIVCVLSLLSFNNGDSNKRSNKVPIYLNTNYSFDERAADLVSRLTLEEKQSLLGNNMAPIPRLGVKSYNVWSEALHGILGGANPSVGLDGPTSFPNSVALGSAWDPDLMQREAAAIADEARAIHATGTKGLTYWSPVVEPIRDPRWGRIFGRRNAGSQTGSREQPGVVELLVENGGDQKALVTLSMEGIIKDDNTLIIRLIKSGNLYTAYCSVDGEKFEKVGTADVVLKNIDAGLIVCDGILPARFSGFRRFMPQSNEPKTPFEVAFDYFHINSSGLK